jgi:hypothetical protein
MFDMTISQALRRIKKLKGELSDLRSRAEGSVTYSVKNPPAFNFGECFEQAANTRSELVRLEARLAATNADTTLTFDEKIMPLVEAIRWLQEFKGQISWIETLNVREQESTTDESWEYTDDMKKVKTITEWHCNLPRKKQAELVKQFKDKFDRLNDAVESTNHRTPLKG